MTAPPAKYVHEWQLRRMFNCGRYYRRLQNGEYSAKTKRRPGIASPGSGQPQGTQSATVRYYDKNNQQVATVHQFILPSGAIGASGHHDPKKLIKNGIVYYSFKDDKPIGIWLTLWGSLNAIGATLSRWIKR